MSERRTAQRPAGHICHVCDEAIAVEEMVILVLSGMWSVQVPELPQLTRQLKLHKDPCGYRYIAQWSQEKLQD